MSLNKLVNQLSVSHKKDYSKILKEFDFSLIDFKSIEHWKPNAYTRNCFYRDSSFELILICWDKGVKTAIHDHDGEDCCVMLLEGEMEEDFYTLNDKGQLVFQSTKTLKKYQLTQADKNNGFHRLKNQFSQRAMSLHLYANPIEESLTLDEVSGKIIKKKLNYNSYKPIALTVNN
ncbi:cysteine dioxygenase family protein [Winogradskyella sp.]|uniref:cysteine dioxygenase n=1 Tax=Winogradskyella sp. TaxID=1883156 RepID=UPI0025FE5298|nr:cysteine dioxygenase family protein [Winogradskyella sp.]MCT4631037.1 cysteine dioxygenase family protein [Winogradskyella sp.]